MLVNAAVVPPRAALEELSAVVGSVRGSTDDAASSAPRRVFGRRRTQVAPSPVEALPALVDVAVDAMRLPVTGFGNLTSHDAHRLSEVLAAAAAEWAVPRVCFAGGAALEFPGDWSVWARLDGDVEALSSIAQGVTRSVEQLGFFVDRRVFRPMLSVATVTESTSGADLDAVVGALDAFRGQEWTVDSVVLMTEGFGGGRGLRELQRIPVGAG